MKTVPVLVKNVEAYYNGFIYKTYIKGVYIDKNGIVYKRYKGHNDFFYKSILVYTENNEPYFKVNNRIINLIDVIKKTFINVDLFTYCSIVKEDKNSLNNSLTNFLCEIQDDEYAIYINELHRKIDDYYLKTIPLEIKVVEKEVIEEPIKYNNVIYISSKQESNFSIFIKNVLTNIVYNIDSCKSLQKLTNCAKITNTQMLSRCDDNNVHDGYLYSVYHDRFPELNKEYIDFVYKNDIEFGNPVYSVTDEKGNKRLFSKAEIEKKYMRRINSLSYYINNSRNIKLKGDLINKVKIYN